VILSVSLAPSGVAQSTTQRAGTVELSSMVGAYVPTAQLSSLVPPCVAVGGCLLTRRQNAAIALGGRVTAWFNRRIALEGSVWYSPSSVAEQASSSFNGSPLVVATNETPASIVATNVRILVSPINAPTMWVYVVGGPALVAHTGEAYPGSTGTTQVGGVVGVGAHLRVARSLALRAELEQYMYSFQGSGQRDLFVSVGLSLASQVRVGTATTP
jgi:hypothetical protein